jgi:hypothetical protein
LGNHSSKLATSLLSKANNNPEVAFQQPTERVRFNKLLPILSVHSLHNLHSRNKLQQILVIAVRILLAAPSNTHQSRAIVRGAWTVV